MGLVRLEAPAADEAEQHQHEHDDQDDVEQAHGSPSWFVFEERARQRSGYGLSRSASARDGQRLALHVSETLGPGVDREHGAEEEREHPRAASAGSSTAP